MDYGSALKKIIELKGKYLEAKFSFWQGKPGLDTSSFKKIRKEIARIKTRMAQGYEIVTKEGQE